MFGSKSGLDGSQWIGRVSCLHSRTTSPFHRRSFPNAHLKLLLSRLSSSIVKADYKCAHPYGVHRHSGPIAEPHNCLTSISLHHNWFREGTFFLVVATVCLNQPISTSRWRSVCKMSSLNAAINDQDIVRNLLTVIYFVYVFCQRAGRALL